MKTLFSCPRWVFLILLVLAAWGVAGCATDSENRHERPWGAPQSWENGLPSSMTERR